MSKEIPLPSPDLIIKVKSIGDVKEKIKNAAIRGEFNKFGVHVQSVGMILYAAGGAIVPKLKFEVVDYDISEWEKRGAVLHVRIIKYEPGSWENAVDTTYKWARAFSLKVFEEVHNLCSNNGPVDDTPESEAKFIKWFTQERPKQEELIQRRVIEQMKRDLSWQSIIPFESIKEVRFINP